MFTTLHNNKRLQLILGFLFGFCLGFLLQKGRLCDYEIIMRQLLLDDFTVVKVMLTATECSDGMSDRTYPLTARVEIGGETLNGCAATAAALDRAGESGRVE